MLYENYIHVFWYLYTILSDIFTILYYFLLYEDALRTTARTCNIAIFTLTFVKGTKVFCSTMLCLTNTFCQTQPTSIHHNKLTLRCLPCEIRIRIVVFGSRYTDNKRLCKNCNGFKIWAMANIVISYNLIWQMKPFSMHKFSNVLILWDLEDNPTATEFLKCALTLMTDKYKWERSLSGFIKN